MDYNSLLNEAFRHGISVYEKSMPSRIKGLYADNIIFINKNQSIEAKACTIAEEIAHYHITVGNILDQTDIRNRKQELKARQWAYQCMLPLDRIVHAHHARISGRFELSVFLGVTEEFLVAAIKRFTEKYGLSVRADDQHLILFEPLGVIEWIEGEDTTNLPLTETSWKKGSSQSSI
jgi:Zn-dependent peptidase ImmA (M78 family)